MKNQNLKLFIIIILFLSFTFISLGSKSINRLVFFKRAAGNQLTIQIKLQGEYDKISGSFFKTRIALYNQTGLVKEYIDQGLTHENQSLFKVTIDTTGLNLGQTYAVFIKPDKYLGKLFCSPTSYSTNCKIPQIAIPSGEGNIDLTQDIFFAGDISPQDGKIAADDISKIAKQIGQVSRSYLATDVNSDGLVQTVDYSLALYSLSKNYVDDSIPFTGSNITPTITIANSPTTVPTTVVIQPTATTIPPTPTVAVSGGTCKATINGKIYGSAFMFSFCSPINNEQASECVASAAECTPSACVDRVIIESRAAINKCASGGSFDETKSRPTLNCQVEFVPGPCVPTPTSAIDCSDDGVRC